MADFFLGCDVSKGYGDFVLLNKRREVVDSSFQLDDTAEGHKALCKYFQDFYKAHEEATIYVGLESTGGYENNWLALLKRLSEVYNLKVTRVDPLAVKKYREACKKRIVTDAVSAHVIAHYLGAFFQEIDFEHDIEFTAMRRQWNLTQLFIKQKTQLSNQLGFLIYQSHPELASYCKDGIPEWVLQLIKKYPTAAELASARVPSVGKIPYVTFEKATNLIAKAKNSVASCTTETDAFVMKTAVEQLLNLDQIIDDQKKALLSANTMPEIKLLATIPGIGEYSAVGLMTSIISIKRFADHKKLAAFFGMHPVFKESGDGRSVSRMSKRGHPQPRAILYMDVLSALICNPVIKKVYERSIRNGMARQAAIGVCMHKMLRIIYGILVSGKPFDAMVDELNQKRKIAGRPKMKVEQKRRFQQPDPAAPVSARQHRERAEKERGKIEPHMNSVHKCGVIDSLYAGKNSFSTGHKDTIRKPGLAPIKTILQAVLEEV
jgi:transposase